MKTGIATVCISGDLDEKLVAIADAGFDGVEIFENDFLSFDGAPRDIGRRIRDVGLDCIVFQPFRDFEGLPEPARSKLTSPTDGDKIRLHIDSAKLFNTRLYPYPNSLHAIFNSDLIRYGRPDSPSYLAP